MNTRLSILSLLVLLCAPLSGFADKNTPGVVMRVVKLDTNKGLVHCALFDSPSGFPEEPKRSRRWVKVRPKHKQVTCAFRNLRPGKYAVAFWHDVDSDNKLDSNFLGIPREPVGASNNASGRFGPPKFKDAAFIYQPPKRVEQTIKLD